MEKHSVCFLMQIKSFCLVCRIYGKTGKGILRDKKYILG